MTPPPWKGIGLDAMTDVSAGVPNQVTDMHSPEPVVTYSNRSQVAYITINRPERRNALSIEVIAALRAAVEHARVDPTTRVVVVSGAGGRCFCAGGDLSEMGKRTDDPIEAHDGRGALGRLFQDLWALGKPTVARVQGYALAGGFGLALACDFVLASHDAVFGTPEVKRGLFPYMISVPMLHWLSPKHALRLMLTGEQVHAARGLDLGFVTEVAPEGGLDELVDYYVEILLQASPEAVRLGRSAFYGTVDAGVRTRLDYLQSQLTVTLGTSDAEEGVRAFFEKRDPSWFPRSSPA